MTSVGVLEAKTQFSALLDRVEAGEEVVITRHGKAIAKIVAISGHDPERTRAAFEDLRRIRERSSLDGLSWKDLRDEGRRY